MAESKTEKQKVQEITEKLEQGIKELFESEKYKTYVNCDAKARRYVSGRIQGLAEEF